MNDNDEYDSDIEYYMILDEILYSSESSSDSEDDPEDERNIQVNRPRIKEFIATVVDEYSDKEFRENFRMNRTTFQHILTLVKDNISSSMDDTGRHTKDAKTQLLLSLWYFATPDSYRSICTKFDVGKATALRAVRRVTDALFDISPQIIRWPSGNYIDEVIQGFQDMGFPNTIGCIDGSYIQIPLPKEDGVAYICRKNFPFQAVCDHRLLFTHCYAGEVGSNHDAMELKKSEIWEYMNNLEKFPNDTHLLGDKAYPCTPQLLTPYKENGHLTPGQRNYNFRHASAHEVL